MNDKQRARKIHSLLLEADRLMGDALRLNSGKNHNALFASKVVDAQLELDDAITYLDPKQTLLKKV